MLLVQPEFAFCGSLDQLDSSYCDVERGQAFDYAAFGEKTLRVGFVHKLFGTPEYWVVLCVEKDCLIAVESIM